MGQLRDCLKNCRGSFNASTKAEVPLGWGATYNVALPWTECGLGQTPLWGAGWARTGWLLRNIAPSLPINMLSYGGRLVLKRRLGQPEEQVNNCFPFWFFLFIPLSLQSIIFVSLFYSLVLTPSFFTHLCSCLLSLLLLLHSLNAYYYLYFLN